jgi:hypothetical protein
MMESMKLYVYKKLNQINDKYLKNFDDVNNYFPTTTDYNIGNYN